MPSLLLFSGLPLDVREPDLAELLAAEPVRLLPSSLAITALHNSAGGFLGTFIVEVGSDSDAERVRRQFSGQVIDGSHSLAVHHILPANQSHPSISNRPVAVVSALERQPKPKPVVKSVQQAKTSVPAVSNDKPPGLKLLARLGKSGKAGDKEKQKLLLDKQRAAIKRGSPGDVLLLRLAKSKGPSKPLPSAGKKLPTGSAVKRGAGGADKVARAKKGKGNKMDVDSTSRPKPAPPSGTGNSEAKVKQPKTQADLDDEMRAYERARRFA